MLAVDIKVMQLRNAYKKIYKAALHTFVLKVRDSRELEQFMRKIGYTDIVVGEINHDEYRKPPVYNFEMHRALFEKSQEPFYSYYKDISRLLIRDKNSKYGYHFGINDFYVYMLAHEYKHYSNSGTGFRRISEREIKTCVCSVFALYFLYCSLKYNNNFGYK